MLQVDGIQVTIKGFVILRGVSLEIPTGELIALVGRNGAGKTTTLKSIMGLVPVTGGTLQLDGIDLLGVPGHRRAALGIGYMPEDRRLIGSLTVEDNLLMPVWASRLEHGAERLAALLDYGDPYQGPTDGPVLVVTPRLGTVSPWASKATDIAHNCGLPVRRVERITEYRLVLKAGLLGDKPQLSAEQLLAVGADGTSSRCTNCFRSSVARRSSRT